jgi:hypothetical protein
MKMENNDMAATQDTDIIFDILLQTRWILVNTVMNLSVT